MEVDAITPERRAGARAAARPGRRGRHPRRAQQPGLERRRRAERRHPRGESAAGDQRQPGHPRAAARRVRRRPVFLLVWRDGSQVFVPMTQALSRRRSAVDGLASRVAVRVWRHDPGCPLVRLAIPVPLARIRPSSFESGWPVQSGTIRRCTSRQHRMQRGDHARTRDQAAVRVGRGGARRDPRGRRDAAARPAAAGGRAARHATTSSCAGGAACCASAIESGKSRLTFKGPVQPGDR